MSLPVVTFNAPNQRTAIAELVAWCKELDGTVVEKVTMPEPQGMSYPGICNWAFKQVCKRMAGRDFFWIEADSIPFKKGWLAAIEAEWLEAKKYGKEIMWAADYNSPFDLVGGIGVYSGNADHLIADDITDDGFDGWTLRHRNHLIHRSKLIQHSYAHYLPNGDIRRKNEFPPDLPLLRKDAVIFHKDQNQGLIGCVRKGLLHG